MTRPDVHPATFRMQSTPTEMPPLQVVTAVAAALVVPVVVVLLAPVTVPLAVVAAAVLARGPPAVPDGPPGGSDGDCPQTAGGREDGPAWQSAD